MFLLFLCAINTRINVYEKVEWDPLQIPCKACPVSRALITLGPLDIVSKLIINFIYACRATPAKPILAVCTNDRWSHLNVLSTTTGQWPF
jgi:di/tricarboxylate transporter